MEPSKAKKNKKSLAIAFCMIAGYIIFQGVSLFFIFTSRSRPFGHGDLSFSLSSDFSKLVYSDIGNGGADLFLLDLKSGQTNRLTNSPNYELFPALSPDGNELVFTRGTSENLADQLCVMDLQTKVIKQLTKANENITKPVFTPDGKSLIYVFETERRGGFAATWRDRGAIAKLDLATMKRTVLIPESSRSSQPTFSFDGKNLVWDSEEGICIAPADKIQDFKLVASPASSPTFSPDGKQIAYITWVYPSDTEVQIFSLKEKKMSRVPNTNEAEQVAFLPDGSLILLMQYDFDRSSAKNRLFKISADGSQRVKLVP